MLPVQVFEPTKARLLLLPQMMSPLPVAVITLSPALCDNSTTLVFIVTFFSIAYPATAAAELFHHDPHASGRSDSLHLIVCECKDTLKVAALGTLFRDHVEAFSGNQLAKMCEIHQVDASWNYRLGMQVNQPREHQPLTLSNRHILKLAWQMHLYLLGDRDLPRGCDYLLNPILFDTPQTLNLWI